MLLALAERTLSSPAVRTDLVWEAPENEARRVHAREQKKENDQWEIKSKKMGADGVRCKTAAATKAHKELVSCWVEPETICTMTDVTGRQGDQGAQDAIGSGECTSLASSTVNGTD
jgi:hypothetical protein